MLMNNAGPAGLGAVEISFDFWFRRAYSVRISNLLADNTTIRIRDREPIRQSPTEYFLKTFLLHANTPQHRDYAISWPGTFIRPSVVLGANAHFAKHK